jgi:hypothetical protein
MSLTRYFYVSDDLDDLEVLEQELEDSGLSTPQIHVLTLDDTGAERHRNLHDVTSLMKKDLVQSTIIGALLGVVGAALVLAIAAGTGWAETPAGWIPWLFLAVIVLGFCTWEGGLWGIQEPNAQFRRFEDAMKRGRHVFFVDIEPAQRATLEAIAGRHAGLEPAGTGAGAPAWIVAGQLWFRRTFFETLP